MLDTDERETDIGDGVAVYDTVTSKADCSNGCGGIAIAAIDKERPACCGFCGGPLTWRGEGDV